MTPADVGEMLAFLGLKDVDELFEDIPAKYRLRGLEIPPGMSELEVTRYFEDILSMNLDVRKCYLGAGVYDTFIPSVVPEIIGRSELYTSYTPYQSEMSQGLLQLIFEYQSLMSELTGMEVINASMYDGSSALGEAALMCYRISEGSSFIVPRAMAPWKKSVLENYLKGTGVHLKAYGFDLQTGRSDFEALRDLAHDACGIYAEMPGFLGLYEEEILDIKDMISGKPLVIGVNPSCLATTVPPGDYGADIVVGEGQPLGIGMNFGGPLLGILGCRKEHVRKMPGRLVGATVDSSGRRSFCLTLQAREQHIRREKANSNICTNQTLLAIASAVYISSMGAAGLEDVARRTETVRTEALDLLRGKHFAPLYTGSGYSEIVLKTERTPEHINSELAKHGIIGGLPLKQILPELGNASLWAFTEKNTRQDLEELRDLLEAYT